MINELQVFLPTELYSNVSIEENIITLKANKSNILDLIKFLRNDERCDFKILTDITAVDYLGKELRFTVTYNLLSVSKNTRIIIELDIDEDESIESITRLYNAAIWFEREVWDMYGIEVNNHPDMRRILTDYGFQGHPLLKDFPLTGYVEVRYDYSEKKVMYEPVKLAQEYRHFDFLSPWQGTEYILPGDEKAKK